MTINSSHDHHMHGMYHMTVTQVQILSHIRLDYDCMRLLNHKIIMLYNRGNNASYCLCPIQRSIYC